jgi:hypothetical protein
MSESEWLAGQFEENRAVRGQSPVDAEDLRPTAWATFARTLRMPRNEE